MGKKQEDAGIFVCAGDVGALDQLTDPRGIGSVMPSLTAEERKAALRFIETCEDGEGYDVPKPMMKRLAELGFVKHKGGGWYEGTPLLDQLQDESE